MGTRPEAIKMVPVYLELKNDPRFEVTLLSTGQHREMLQQVFDIFGITPDIDLEVMKPNQTLATLTSTLIEKSSAVYEKIQPDAVLVHGDTTTCFSAGIAAFYQQIPIGHVEAGLRTYNFQAPWPEEMNRRLIDPISKWCFAPTDRAAANLRQEHTSEENIYTVGNTVVDALRLATDMERQHRPEIDGLNHDAIRGKRVILVTGHRRESFGKPFENFCNALLDLVEKYPDVALVYPVHLNPKVQEPVHRIIGNQPAIHLIEPVGYLQMAYLMDSCHFIITDSGGIQEEAPSFGKPVLVTRDTTERPEAVDSGAAKLVGTDPVSIITAATDLLNSNAAYQAMVCKSNPYGDGYTSKKIADILGKSIAS
ncbi:MAG: UDP-N-acetylglucosamine 2-epimerase (non-hydrolyzing) [Pirellulaceae bacterium]|nr:UDP-N-acetylglucosamine 2-epimerase (non-hydrolyzing) [Pirellulaceae bacterium]